MSAPSASPVVDTTREYYNSQDADSFYHRVWGGKDIHIGCYTTPDEPIATASHRTVERMAARLAHWPQGTRLLDIGAAYGGAARHLAQHQHFAVTCLNLAERQNDRNRQLNAVAGLADQIEVLEGNFEALPFAPGLFDLVWSQDSILHSGRREQVFAEVDRVLRPGGEFIFTDPMQTAGANTENLRPVLDRIHLDSLGSVEDYTQFAAALGWETIGIETWPDQLVTHYSRVREELGARRTELVAECAPAYVDRMLAGLGHWIEAGRAGFLTWGILHFRKPQE